MFSAPIPDDDEARLAALHRYSILDSDPEQAYDDITALAAYICRAPFSTITLIDRERQWFKSEVGVGTNETNRSDGFCSCAILRPETMIVEDALLDPRFAGNPFVLGQPEIRFYAGAPLISPDGYVLGTVCVFDTQPRHLETDQVRALEALARQVMGHFALRLQMMEAEKTARALRTAEKLAVVGRLASSMAHEINNPLQSVTNLLFLAKASEQLGEVRSALGHAQEELARVTHIVTQGLRFHQQSEKPAPSKLGEIIESVLLLFQTRFQHASVKVEIEDRQLEPLVCLRNDLRQVFANLFSNALDAVAGHAPAKITVRIRPAIDARTGRSGVRVTLADSGAGMDAEARAHIFEPFFSTKGARGTGLGLWVSRSILDKHSARVGVKSASRREMHGTVFAIFFPFESQLLEAAAVSEPAYALGGPQTPS